MTNKETCWVTSYTEAAKVLPLTENPPPLFELFLSNLQLPDYSFRMDNGSGRPDAERDGTRAETRIGLSAKRTSPFKSAGGSVQSTAGSRGVRISGSNGSNAGYTVFWGRVQDCWLPTPLACFPFTSPPVRHRVPPDSACALHTVHCSWMLKYNIMMTLRQECEDWIMYFTVIFP